MIRAALTFARRALGACLARIDGALQPSNPPDPSEFLTHDEIARRSREESAKARRASRSPWYYRRQNSELKLPESLKYYEAIHGTKATFEMLRRQAKNRDE